MSTAKTVKKHAVKKSTAKPESNGHVEHPVRENLRAQAKREGVWVTKARPSGFLVRVNGTLHQTHRGIFPSIEQAKTAAKAAGFEVKSVPAAKAKK